MVSIKNNWIAVAFVVVFAIALFVRVGAFSHPYHHDEYKWAKAADSSYHVDDSIPHPPLAREIYHVVGGVLGYDNLRIVPVIASLLLILLLFIISWRLYGSLAAFLVSVVYVVAFYATLGSMQIDIDGALLPLAILATIGGYLLWRNDTSQAWKKTGPVLLGIGIVAGFAFKLSFGVIPLALFIDYAWREPKILRFFKRKDILSALALIVVAGGLLLALLWNQLQFLRYVDNFVALGGRDYFQLLFQTVKGLVYSSPLLIGGLVLGWRHRRELSIWYILLVLNILFYYVVFDFSHRTFDRYLLFVVLPASILAGFALSKLWSGVVKEKRFLVSFIAAFPVLGLITYILFSIPHRVIPLIPKTAFIDAIMSGHWSFLLPLTGGSGPAGFYMPVDALAFLWAVATVSIVAFYFLRLRTIALGVFIAAALVYNIFITLEYVKGTFYGSTSEVIASLVEYIDSTHSTSTIITYNDIAAWPLLERGLYAGRFYPHDAYVTGNLPKFINHKGEYLVVQMPEINANSGYGRYFAACKPIYTATSGQISGSLLDCHGVPVSLIDDESS